MDVELETHRALSDLAYECGKGAFFPLEAIEAQIDQWPLAMTVEHRKTKLTVALEDLRRKGLVNVGEDGEGQHVWQARH